MLKIAKFGGSSLANHQQFQKVKQIIEQDPLRKVVVVSAIGRRDARDAKLTDLLYLLHAHLMYSVPYEPVLAMIEERFLEIKEALHLSIDIKKQLLALKKELNKQISLDYLVSRGEYFTAQMMAEYINFAFVDASELVFFYFDGSIDYEKTENAIRKAFQEHEQMVVPGFYGVYPNGAIRIMARGGSDITGSIMARSLSATVYENWTDVSGLLMADPRIVVSPKRIAQITYEELRELAYMGANVLHEETIFPIQDMNIPIVILNTNDAFNPGTIITQVGDDTTQVITGIAGKKHFASFTITKHNGSSKTKLMREILALFESYHINVEHIPSSIDSFSIVVLQAELDKVIYDIASSIKNRSDVKNLTIDQDIALVAIVGRNMVTRPGISGKIFAVIGNEGINIKMIAQGSNELNIIVGISNEHFEKTICALYQHLVV
ncbi:MAG: aspartate kinase [Bacilli bacterium]|nr:aspartate kinase [Bacilli bacterium]